MPACWTCGRDAALKIASLGAPVCSAACRDEAMQHRPARIPAASPAAQAVARVSATLARRWRAVDGEAMVVPRGLIAVQPIGPYRGLGKSGPGGPGDDDSSYSSSDDTSSDDTRSFQRRRTDADEPAADYGLLAVGPADLLRHLAPFLPFDQVTEMALDDWTTWRPAVTTHLAQLRVGGVPDLGSLDIPMKIDLRSEDGLIHRGMYWEDMIIIMVGAMANSDWETFNVATHIAVTQILREIYNDESTLPAHSGIQANVVRSMGGVFGGTGALPERLDLPLLLDYARLCDSTIITMFLWTWIALKRGGYVPWYDPQVSPFALELDLITLPNSFGGFCATMARAYMAEYWYTKTYSISPVLIEMDASVGVEPLTRKIILDRPVVLLPVDDDEDSDDYGETTITGDVPGSSYYNLVENVDRTTITNASGIYHITSLFGVEVRKLLMTKMLAIVAELSAHPLGVGNVLNDDEQDWVVASFPAAGLSSFPRTCMSRIPYALIFRPAQPPQSPSLTSSASAAAAAATASASSSSSAASSPAPPPSSSAAAPHWSEEVDARISCRRSLWL